MERNHREKRMRKKREIVAKGKKADSKKKKKKKLVSCTSCLVEFFLFSKLRKDEGEKKPDDKIIHSS